MEKIKYFFWLCSGANIALLKKCETEASKYVGIGATVFFTGVFAAMASSYAMFTVFDSWWVAIPIGILWGLMIFNLDRYIVSSMRKNRSKKQEMLTALPRIILAILVSLVIAKPLELKIFEKEIQSELTLMEQELFAAQEAAVAARFTADQEKLKAEISQLKNEIELKALTRDELDRQAREEADGTGGSKRKNLGPIYKVKKDQADKASEELEKLVARNNLLIWKRSERLSRNDSIRLAEFQNLERRKIDGPANRLEALHRLAEKSYAIALANWFILLLFIAVETAPIFVKLISSTGPYDHLLKIEEHGFETQKVESLARVHAEIKARTEPMPPIESEFINDRLNTILSNS